VSVVELGGTLAEVQLHPAARERATPPADHGPQETLQLLCAASRETPRATVSAPDDANSRATWQRAPAEITFEEYLEDMAMFVDLGQLRLTSAADAEVLTMDASEPETCDAAGPANVAIDEGVERFSPA
jgi:hypothetical protein